VRIAAWVALLVCCAPAVPAQQRQALPSLPLTELDERLLAAELDNRAFTLTFAQPLPINDLLLLIVRGTNLSIVPDPDITGSFMGELKNVTVRQALGLILPPLGLGYGVDGSVIRVFRLEPETRLFDINYVASVRTGSSRIGAADDGGSYANVETTTAGDIFADIERGVQTLLSDQATFNVDRKAGLLQVTDFPERLDRIGVYLDAVMDRAYRQVQIDARVLEVELTDEHARSLDWGVLTQTAASPAGADTRAATTGLRITDVGRFLAALETQGSVTLLGSPRLQVVNNEPAIVRA
jgi:MSHA biogenesis protein MshL